MHFGVNAAIVRLLINDKPFCARLDNREIILSFHRTYLNGNRRKIGSKRANAFGKIIAARKLWMLAGDKKNLTKSLAGEMLCFGHYFVDMKRDAEDRIIA